MNNVIGPPKPLQRFWRGVGWFGIVLLLYLSLTPQPPAAPGGDKLGHALAYATLMYWWAQLMCASLARLRLAATLIVLGIAIEYVQGWTGWRAFEYWDMVADAVGVALGWALAAITPNVLKLLGRTIDRQK